MSPSTSTGSFPAGLIFRNAGLRCSPASRSTVMASKSTPNSCSVQRTRIERVGANSYSFICVPRLVTIKPARHIAGPPWRHEPLPSMAGAFHPGAPSPRADVFDLRRFDHERRSEHQTVAHHAQQQPVALGRGFDARADVERGVEGNAPFAVAHELH